MRKYVLIIHIYCFQRENMTWHCIFRRPWTLPLVDFVVITRVFIVHLLVLTKIQKKTKTHLNIGGHIHTHTIPKPVLWFDICRSMHTQCIVLCQPTDASCYATMVCGVWHKKHENHVKRTNNDQKRQKMLKIEKSKKVEKLCRMMQNRA